MSINRREFMKLAGLSVLGAGGATIVRGDLLEAALYKQNPNGLTAKRWGMVIDVRKINSIFDYKKIQDACHSIHNVPHHKDKKHEVKWIWKDSFEATFPGAGDQFPAKWVEEKPFILMCNHCEQPPCVRVCPTQATFKRKSDGIVAMDYHRCIGCRFCMAACPFGARSFNWVDPRLGLDMNNLNRKFPTRTMGVVEKCNFCVERLAVGEGPNCAKNSNGAMVYGDLNDPNSEVRQLLRNNFAIMRKPELGTRPSVHYIITSLEEGGQAMGEEPMASEEMSGGEAHD